MKEYENDCKTVIDVLDTPITLFTSYVKIYYTIYSMFVLNFITDA